MHLTESRKILIEDITRKIYFRRKRTEPYSEIEKVVVRRLSEKPIISKNDI